jgi:hypothetical protein
MSYLFVLTIPVSLILISLTVLLADRRSRWRNRARVRAEEKAIALLWSWLTPEQQQQWASNGVFEVIGCDTGTRYRVTCAPVMNIYELDPVGCPVAQWCFAPKGSLAPGDVLLAQKIALETMERDVLALANRSRCLVFRARTSNPNSPVVRRYPRDRWGWC